MIAAIFVLFTIQLSLLHIQLTSSVHCSTPTSNSINADQVPDHYWKDYFGIIPDDAIEGGTNGGGPTYIGQAYIQNFELLPVTIYPGCQFAETTAYGKKISTDKNIKILCAKDKSKFEWIVTKNEETHLLTNRYLVVGGSEIGHTLNIGRVNFEGRVIIGKIFSYPLPNRGLSVLYDEKPVLFLSYEILTYNCNKTNNKNNLPMLTDVGSE